MTTKPKEKSRFKAKLICFIKWVGLGLIVELSFLFFTIELILYPVISEYRGGYYAGINHFLTQFSKLDHLRLMIIILIITPMVGFASFNLKPRFNHDLPIFTEGYDYPVT